MLGAGGGSMDLPSRLFVICVACGCPGDRQLFLWAAGAVCPIPSTVPREPICCGCRTGLGGRLPVPRAEAALPYWVPLTLRPRKQIQKMARAYIPRMSKVCPCPCHRFGGRLPTPRDQAVMPYWVPQYLRTQKRILKRQQNLKGLSEHPLDLHCWYNRWRICCDRPLLLKWQQLQALHHDTPAPGRAVSLPDPVLLPLGLSLLTLLHTVLRVLAAIRCSSITSPITLAMNPCLRLCFWGTQDKTEVSSALISLPVFSGRLMLEPQEGAGQVFIWSVRMEEQASAQLSTQLTGGDRHGLHSLQMGSHLLRVCPSLSPEKMSVSVDPGCGVCTGAG
ncbi:uncharacterized protein C16orf95 homolog [Trichechus manatus latirostris]|uniref:Uncharacterized protein C16orf95 homolog n=1 Tax=Trichechus manatus latirostris TaxID=127582 RepID=A0A2Y9DNC7_TRIMA|nr:uncharacterized protein C16orf95 homolog [Trichechus manatus latirostris]